MPAPRRTCAACREEAERDELVRLALAPDGGVVLDYRGKLPGRGAWLHPTRACAQKVEDKPGLLGRPFKQKVAKAVVVGPLRQAVRQGASQGLSIAASAGQIIGGHDALEAALQAKEIRAVVVASDASDRTISSLQRAAEGSVPFVPMSLTRDQLGALVGQPPRAAIGATFALAADYAVAQLRRLADLG